MWRRKTVRDRFGSLAFGAALWLACCTAANTADGEDWPCFLGPNHNGVSAETGLIDTFPDEGPNVLWEKTLGTGYAAPSVRGQRIVFHHRLRNQEIVECCHAVTGESLWKRATPSQYRDPYGYNNGPRCTPVLTETLCYSLGAEGRLLCLRLADGAVVWEHELAKEFEIPAGFFGVGCSPLLYAADGKAIRSALAAEGDLLIVLVGGQPQAGVVAFDAKSGTIRWKNVGKSTWNGVPQGRAGKPYEWTGEEMVVSYSSPVAAEIAGHHHLLCLMRQGLVSLDPQTGDENFHYWFRPLVHESVNAATPVVVDNTVLLSAAYRLGSVLLRIADDGKSCTEIWSSPKNLLTHWSTAIPLQGHYLGFSGRHEEEGELRCVSGKDGSVIWSTIGCAAEKVKDYRINESGEVVDTTTSKTVPHPLYGRGSAILADDKVFILTERGTLAVMKADPTGWHELARCKGHKMRYPSWTAPVLCQGRMYLRCEESLVCLDVQGGKK